MCTRDGFEAIYDLAERHRDSLPVANDYLVKELAEGIRKYMVRAMVDEKQDESAIKRVLTEAVEHADKNHIERTYHFPCVVVLQEQPPQFPIGAVVFTSAKSFPQIYDSRFRKANAIGNRPLQEQATR